MKPTRLLSVFLLALLTCYSSEDPLQTDNYVNDFINSIVDIMESNSINQNTIDWNDFREQLLERASVKKA